MFEYFNQFEYYAIFILVFYIVILIVFQILSIKWYLNKNSVDKLLWISHCLLFGITIRYISLLQSYLHAFNTKAQITSLILQNKSDVYKLHLLYFFVKSIPQIIFNASIISTMNNWIPSLGSSLVMSSISVIVLLIQYLRSRPITKEILASGVITKYFFELFWNIFTLIARIALFTLIVICFQFWVFILIGLHWIFYVFWILNKSNWDDLSFLDILHKVMISLSNCFVLVDFDDTFELLQIFIYYTIFILESVCGILLCFLIKSDMIHSKLLIILTSLSISSSIMSIGIIFLYHKYFYNVNGKIKFKKKIAIDAESTDNTLIRTELQKSIRKSLKHSSSDKTEVTEAETTDKKLLLENLVARSGTPTFICTPILDENTSNDVLFHSIINETITIEENNKDESFNNLNNKFKRRGICSVSDLENVNSTENSLFLENDDQISDLSASKRRGICSSVELEHYHNILSDNISEINKAVDIKRKRKPIYVTFDNNDVEIISTENTCRNNAYDFSNENCEVESKVSDDSKYTLILSAPSEIMSAHDYENICAVNITREFWGLRSWRGYSDIETWLHDDSIVRDQDNITSTVATSTSSEISLCDAFENVSLSADNMTFLLDNNPIDISKISQMRFKSLDNKEDLFNAKPYIVDQNGGLLPLATLTPIKEELEESPEKNESSSTLVTTIDVIRKNTDTNSPLYVYHRTENILESPTNNKSLYKPRALWSSDNIPKSTKPIYENNSIIRNKLIANSQVLMKLCDNELKNCDNLTNIMYLDKPIISSSLQSLVSSSSSEDILSISEVARCFPLVRKPTGRPRRKFSLIRDRFEMTLKKQVDLHSDLRHMKQKENDLNVPNTSEKNAY